MKFSTERKINLGFGAALLFLILISIVSYASIHDYSKAADSRNEANKAVKSLKATLSDLQDAETGQRGFLITGEEEYLEPYLKGVNSVTQQVNATRAFTTHSTNRNKLDALNSLIAGKLAELDQTIELRKDAGFEAARQFVLTDKGKNIMDQIRKVIATMESEHEQMVAENERKAQIEANRARFVIILGSLLAIGIVTASSIVIRKELAERRRIQEALETKNRELQEALANVKTLGGLLPICANCKKIRDDKGYWNQIELFIRDRSNAKFSHGICPDCARTLYPTLYPKTS
jgi:CHASE3 domain sensor protein